MDCLALALAAACVCSAVSLTAQTTSAAKVTSAKKAVDRWSPPRTPWGDPDLQGVFSNADEYGLPFEWPTEYEGRRLEDISPAGMARIVSDRRRDIVARAPLTDPATWPRPWTFGMHLTKKTDAERPFEYACHEGNSKTPPTREVYQTAVINNQFALPPGADNYLVEAEGTFTEDVRVWSVHGHMHYRGKDMTYAVTYPDGRTETVFRIPKWDLNWQQEFWLESPIVLPKGSKLRVTSHFDNSSRNPLNPDPKATVTWGDQTWQEMMGGFIQYTVEDPAGAKPATRGAGN